VKVFVTGGAGFIGSHLAERLLDGGDEVLVLDDLATGEDMLRRVPDLSKLERVTGFRPRIPLARMIEGVVEDRRARLASGRPGRE